MILAQDHRDGRVVVLFRDGRREERDCREEGACSPIVVVPTLPSTGDRVRGFFEAVLAGFHEEPERYVVLMSRGAGSGVRDAVVELKAGVLDLSPALDGNESASFGGLRRATTIVLTKVAPSGAGSSDSQAAIHAQWSSATPRIELPTLTPGLYALDVLDARKVPMVPTAWVLVADSDRYTALSAAYSNAMSVTREWGKAARGGETRAALRAYLDQLAAELGSTSKGRE